MICTTKSFIQQAVSYTSPEGRPQKEKKIGVIFFALRYDKIIFIAIFFPWRILKKWNSDETL